MALNRYDPQNESGSIRLTPDPVTGEYRYVPAGHSNRADPPREKRTRGAVRYIAAGLAVCVISAVSGGGAAYYVLRGYTPPQAADSALPDTVQQAPLSVGQDSTPNVAYQSESVADVVSLVSSSVVEILLQIPTENGFFGTQLSEGSGSGVVLTGDGYIATNYHVVAQAASIKVRTFDGAEYDATVIGTDSRTDLAVIKIDAAGLNPIVFADSSKIQVGETAIAIGNPLGTLGGTVTTGIISAKDRQITIDNESMTLLQTSAAVNPGNSGGGLFNSRGELMGIVNAKSTATNVEGLGFAIPSNLVLSVTNDVIEKGYVSGRPELGISVYAISDSQTAFRYRVNEFGVYITSTTRDNGLQVGDLLVRIDGMEIKVPQDIRTILDDHKVGDVLEIGVKRGQKLQSVSVTLLEQIPDQLKQPEIAA